MYPRGGAVGRPSAMPSAALSVSGRFQDTCRLAGTIPGFVSCLGDLLSTEKRTIVSTGGRKAILIYHKLNSPSVISFRAPGCTSVLRKRKDFWTQHKLVERNWHDGQRGRRSGPRCHKLLLPQGCKQTGSRLRRSNRKNTRTDRADTESPTPCLRPRQGRAEVAHSPRSERTS